jgi:hypothetical protein
MLPKLVDEPFVAGRCVSQLGVTTEEIGWLLPHFVLFEYICQQPTIL